MIEQLKKSLKDSENMLSIELSRQNLNKMNIDIFRDIIADKKREIERAVRSEIDEDLA